ncbi:PadR family transcriptional regulator [Candidatus Bathyarchaeota archaeon]|nr:PadR family transcriptional regulator [Candidatus Bathyarchaeota archaeon]
MSSKTVAWIKEVYKGYLRLVILMLLTKKPMHGYEIMNEVEARTLGFWRPTAGGVYPLLKKMEKKKEVKSKWIKISKRDRKIYEITVNGKRKLQNALKKQEMLTNTLNGLCTEFLTEILEVKPQLKLKPLSLFQNILPLENLKPKTGEEKKRILLTLKSGMEEALEATQEILDKINQKLNQIE